MRSIAMIPTHQIHVLNPRSRSRHQHLEIINNIKTIGLKRPITVSRKTHPEGVQEYDLVCGQGRLEAFQALGLKEIPAFVVDARKADCMVMSLVENIARRQHPAIETMREIQGLHDRGYNDSQIAQKIGVTASWVGMVVGLLERGEERLVAAVETGLIPISLAVDMARSDDAGIQQLLADAYAEGVLKGKKLAIVRRLLEQRARKGKSHQTPRIAGRRGSRKLTVEHLRRIFEREVESQQLLIKKADIAQSRLLFVTQAFQDLRGVKEFVDLLRGEGMETLPRALDERMSPRTVA